MGLGYTRSTTAGAPYAQDYRGASEGALINCSKVNNSPYECRLIHLQTARPSFRVADIVLDPRGAKTKFAAGRNISK